MTISDIFFQVLTIFANFASLKCNFYSYFNCILLYFCANKYIISEISRSISLWINKANLFNLAFVMRITAHIHKL